MKRHFLGRALVAVPDEWIDRLLPDVRRVNELLKARNSRLQTGGKRQAHDKVSDRAAEGFLQTTLYTGVAFLAEFAISYTEIWDGVCAAQAACSCRYHTYPRI
ncbi:hypothetical protein WJX77_008932 [Trebouxia sp. C0004]